MKRNVPTRGQASKILLAAVPSPDTSRQRLFPDGSPRSILAVRRRAILEAMLRCGLRSIEVVNLRRDEVEWPSERNRGQCWLHLHVTKGMKPREVPVPDVALEWFNKWSERSEDFLREHGLSTGYFFHRIHGQDVEAPLTTRFIRDLTERVTRKALGDEAKRMSPHAFRHAYCTNALEEGVPLQIMAAAMGHASMSTTEGYSHARRDEMYKQLKGSR